MKWSLTKLFLFGLLIFQGCGGEIYQKKYEAASKTANAADDLLEATSTLNVKIEGRLEENPNSATRDFVSVIDSRRREVDLIRRKTEDIQKNRIINSKSQFEKLRQFQGRLNTINYELNAINTSLDKELDKKLSSDITFETGSYSLSSIGKEELRKFVFNEIINLVEEWNEEDYYKERNKRIKITVSGYADLQGPSDVSKRRELNLKISEKRAESVKSELQSLLDEIEDKYKILVEYRFEGKGEEPPPGTSDLKRVNNPERRVCMISSYVIPKF